MSLTGRLPDGVSDPWRYALVGGLVAFPLVALRYWRTGSWVSAAPVVLGGAVAGYLAVRHTGTRRGVGARVGIVSGLPVLLAAGEVVAAAGALAGPRWFVAGGTVFAVLAAVLLGAMGFVLLAFAGELGAWIGGRLAGWEIRRRGPPAGS